MTRRKPCVFKSTWGEVPPRIFWMERKEHSEDYDDVPMAIVYPMQHSNDPIDTVPLNVLEVMPSVS